MVNKDILNAFCLPGGKIVVFTGLIKHFPTSDEIATVLGHEVGCIYRAALCWRVYLSDNVLF